MKPITSLLVYFGVDKNHGPTSTIDFPQGIDEDTAKAICHEAKIMFDNEKCAGVAECASIRLILTNICLGERIDGPFRILNVVPEGQLFIS
ncbi:MAG: hypothetical protein WCV55_01075 [Candidatus Paceibacterota bacterium]